MDYFLRAPDEKALRTALRALHNKKVDQKNLGKDAKSRETKLKATENPDDYSNDWWCTHGFDVAKETGYLALIRPLKDELTKEQITDLEAAGIEVLFGDTAPTNWMAFQ